MKNKLIYSLLTLIPLVLFIFSGCQIDSIQTNSTLASANTEANPLLEMPEVKQVITEISTKIEAGELKPGSQKKSRSLYDITLNPSGPIVTTSTIVSVTATASPGQIVGQWYLYKETNPNTPVELIASVPPYPTVKTIDINLAVHGDGVFRISALVFSSTGIHIITSWPISITKKKEPVKVSGAVQLTSVGTGTWNTPATWSGYPLYNITASVTLTSGQGYPLQVPGTTQYWFIGFASTSSYNIALTQSAYSYTVGSAGGSPSLFNGLSSGYGINATTTNNSNVYSTPSANNGYINIVWTGYYQP